MSNEYRGVPLYGQKATGDPVTLDDHETASQARYESVIGCIEDVKENVLEVKAVLSAGAGSAASIFANKLENEMGMDNIMDKINLNVGESGGGVASVLPMAAMAMMGNRGGFGGAALGAGAAGLLAGALLSNNGGIFGGRHDGAAYSRDSAPLNGTDGMAIINAIGGVKDTVGMSTMSITNQLSEGFAAQTTNTLQLGIMLGNQASMNQAMTIAAVTAVNQNVSDQGCRTREAICVDGNATRGLITQLNTDNLNRLLTVADLDRRDAHTHSRQRDVEVNVAQTVNQVQAQAQQQQQQQQITGLLTHLCGVVGNLQSAVATNSNLIVGNTGATTTGAQTANPVNVKG